MHPTISSLRPLLSGLFFTVLATHWGPVTAQHSVSNPTSGAAQTASLWQPVAAPVAARGPVAGPPARWFRLDTTQLAARLALAPLETRPEAAVVLELPHPDGKLHRYTLTQVPVMAPALAARYPRLRTFAGRALDEPTATVRLEWTPTGLHAQLRGADGTVSSILGNESPPASALYQSRVQAPVIFDCQALLPPGTPPQRPGDTPPAPPAPYGGQLRTLRLAVATTNEFVNKLGGGTKVGTMSALVKLVNSLNGVYERELTLRLQLVATNDNVIFTDAASDPFGTSTSPTALLGANAAVLNTRIGAANYDLGHVLGYSGGGYSGVAYVGVVCSNFSGPSGKGGGASTASSSGYLSEVTLHEIGHQLGSNHTFNGSQGNCGGGNRGAELAYEPGAGNTIMSYDSRCAPDNVGPGIEYFHAASLSAIMPKLTCGSTADNGGNHAPVAQVPADSFVIPKGTPFALTGSGSDPDKDQLTYSWEQLDLGNASGLTGAATDASAPPLFRSFAPAANPTRVFPQLSTVLTNTSSLGEILPLVARPLNFRLTVRDGRGGVAGANLAFSVADAGPFRVTAPAAALTAAPGSTYAVTWDVLGTDQEPINCKKVRIMFSSDGGQTFTVLAAEAPNNGTASVRLPRVTTTAGRLKIEAVGNVFFAISPATITLSGTPVPLPVTLLDFTAEARNTAAHLSWRTATELNNAGFAVEVSTDGTTFRRRAWVPGRGQAATYSFDDDQLLTYSSKLVYYRLRQLDFDSTASLSEVRPVTVPVGTAAWQIWPNPTHESRVTVAGLPPGQPVQLLDLTGRVLLTTAMPPTGPLTLELPTPIRPGIYLVRSGGQSRRLVVE